MRKRAVAVLAAAWALAAPAQETAWFIRTVAGSGNVGDGGPAVLGQLSDAQGVAVDAAGNVYIADPDNHRVRRVNTQGVIETLAGTGTAGYSGDGGPATLARLNAPYGVAVGLDGSAYIADLGNRRVRRVAADGAISTVAGNGLRGSEGDGGLAVEAQLMAPRNVALDARGNLYISDFEAHRIRRVDTEGVITTFAGNGVQGAGGDGSQATGAELAYPAGLAFDAAGSLYIADSGNNRIRKVASGFMATALGPALEGVPSPELQLPTGVAVDASGTLYIADSGKRRILARSFTLVARVVAGSGASGGLTFLETARDVAVDLSGNIFIADGHRVRRLTPAGLGTTVAGDGTFGFRGEGGLATLAQLNAPSGVAVATDGTLYIADERNHRVRKIDASGNITTAAGTGVPGFGLDGPAAVVTAINSPTGISIDSAGIVWIPELNGNRVRKMTPLGAILTVAGTSADLRGPAAAIADNEGNVYIAESLGHRVRKMSVGGALATIAGNGTRGSSGDGAMATWAQLDTPRGLALDSSGNLYIADTNNHRIRRVGRDGRIATVAGGSTSLSAPRAVAVGPGGTLFIADTGNHRIVTLGRGGILTPIAGTGVAGFSGDGGLALAAYLNFPSALAFDSQGNLYVADQANHRIRKLSIEPSPVVEPVEEPPVALRVSNAASLQPGPVAPGEMVSLFASGIGPASGVSGKVQPNGLLEDRVADAQVLFDGRPAPIYFAQESQINAQVPYAVHEKTKTEIEVRYLGVRKAAAVIEVARAAPGLFTLSGGTGPILAVGPDGNLVMESNPAPAGSIVTLYATGEGQTTPGGVEGKPVSSPPPQALLPVALSIGGEVAELLFAAPAPGLIGLFQLNVRIPAGLRPGPAPVVLTVGSAHSQDGVTLAVK